MVKKIVRPYELSLWTLQDEFLCVLKPINLSPRGQIENPIFNLKNDGTQELSFSIPMYYREKGELVENPVWFQANSGVLLVNLRKLKLIFHKNTSAARVFEFVITDITERHTDGQLSLEVTASGLAFQELGKVGYKISLNQDTFMLDYEEWAEDEDADPAAEPIATIDYWMDKILKNSNWKYKVKMDWAAYDGILNNEMANEQREQKGLRRTDKIYEDEYIDSWGDDNGQLVPLSLVDFQEKARMFECDKSNIYNITQDLAETFGVFCRYEYEYDHSYHIIGKIIVFYNNFLKDGIDINYPYDSSSIERTIDSNDVVTKLFVVPISDDTSASGLITIADVSANKSREDYILNFDYLYQIGTISKEQYDMIPDYERSMFLYNTELEPLSVQIAQLNTDLVSYEADRSVAVAGQTQAKEQMEQATALLDSITNGTGILEKTKDTPYRGVLLNDTLTGGGTYYIKITQEGVLDPLNGYPIKIYYYRSLSSTTIEKEFVEYTGSFSIARDAYGNINALRGITCPSDAYNRIFYVTFSYRPQLYYENIYNTFANQLAADEAKEAEATKEIERINETLDRLNKRYDQLLEEKATRVADFENMMGPALREGSWQADEYTDYGTKYSEDVPSATGGTNAMFIWDEQAFDGEQLSYEETFGDDGQAISREYYPCIDLTNHISEIQGNLDKLSFIYGGTHQMTIGSTAQFGFLRNPSTSVVRPVLFLTGLTIDDTIQDMVEGNPFVGLITTELTTSGVDVKTEVLFSVEQSDWIGLQGTSGSYHFDTSDYESVYPRIRIPSLLLKTSEDELYVYRVYNDNRFLLEKFYDYTVLPRDESYFITIKGAALLEANSINDPFHLEYTISNSALSLYLDGLEVSETNAFPQVSYTVKVSALNENFMIYAYDSLNEILRINDTDLKLENVRGYISELELNLNNPWEDEITVQNYRTKFEDLFSTIVASTEEMKSNSSSYNNAANAFTSTGTLKPSVIQDTINNVDLNYAFQNGNLTIDDVDGIWARSDSGVVAIRGGGIFCATEQDAYGNWLWNTGITPYGINASLITAGQLDTNLVRIFAGDNLRLQMNADGLFAYKQDEIGEADLTEFVVHNSEGLFLKDLNIPVSVDDPNAQNRVEISWDGLILRNQDGEKVFYADSETGDLIISGVIDAASGDIGGWKIEENYLYNEAGTAGLRSGVGADEQLTSPYDIFWVYGENDDYFRVQSDGTLYANNVILKGNISANSIIGNVTAGDISNAIKKISVESFSGGGLFELNNPNLDGNIIVSPSFLRYRILTNGLNAQELENSDPSNTHDGWVVSYRVPGAAAWTELDLSLVNDNFSFESDYLTMTIGYGIMENGGEYAEELEFKVDKHGYEIQLDSEGQPVSDSYSPTIYSTTFSVSLQDNGTNQILSAIDPPTYAFVMNEEDQTYESSTTFSVTLQNIDTSAGQWYLDDVAANTQTGTGELNNGVIISNTTGGSTITIPHTRVPEGGQVIVKYTVNGVSRTAFVQKNRTGSANYLTVLRSSNGTTFLNGEGQTVLSIELYYGSQLMNGADAETQYYYLWKKDDTPLTSLTLEDGTVVSYPANGNDFFTNAAILVGPEYFTQRAVYACYIYSTVEEAIADFNS